MLERMLACALIAAAALPCPGRAADADRASRSFAARQVAAMNVIIPGTDYRVSFEKGRATGRPVPEPLLRAIVTWLANNFGLPADYVYPTVAFVPATTIATFHYTGLLSDSPRDAAAVPAHHREVVAAYDGIAKAIYLPAHWTGVTPAELSMLVHEMVHHLQHVARIRYPCPQASEELAYAAQDRWLGLFGRDLATDFDLDPFTVTVSIQCIY